MAIKILLVQFTSVNVQLWRHARALGFSFSKVLRRQLFTAAFLLALAVLSDWVSLRSVPEGLEVARFFCAGAGYLFGMIAAKALMPRVFPPVPSFVRALWPKGFGRLGAGVP